MVSEIEIKKDFIKSLTCNELIKYCQNYIENYNTIQVISAFNKRNGKPIYAYKDDNLKVIKQFQSNNLKDWEKEFS